MCRSRLRQLGRRRMNRTADELTLYEWDKFQYPATIVVRGSFASSFCTVFAYRNS